MKKVFLVTILLAISFGFAQAQYVLEPLPKDQEKKTSQTTEEEYNYVTKEYKSYLPLKIGYKLEDEGTVSYSLNEVDRIFNFKKLIRIDSNEEAAIIVEFVRVSKGRTYIIYFCIPGENSTDGIWKLVQDTIEQFQTTEVRNAYIWALTKYISKSIQPAKQ